MGKKAENLIVKDIPSEGRIIRIGEDTIDEGSLFSLKKYLRITLYVENEILGITQQVRFIRPGETGDILSGLIDDFEAGKELRIRGETFYFLKYYVLNLLKHYQKESYKDVEAYINKIKHLVNLIGIIDWKEIPENDKKTLSEFFENCPTVFDRVGELEVLVDGKIRYSICMNGDAADIYLEQSE